MRTHEKYLNTRVDRIWEISYVILNGETKVYKIIDLTL